MAEFSVNTNRFDPYKNFKFRIKWDGRYVAGISKVSGLSRHTDVIEYRQGGDPSMTRQMPGVTRYDPVTLIRGVTHDPEFEEWASKVWSYGSGLGAEASLKNFRKDIVLELMNEAGQVVLSYQIFRCWVSDYTALPDLNANAPQVAFQSITLVHEGWERDKEVAEPSEPDF